MKEIKFRLQSSFNALLAFCVLVGLLTLASCKRGSNNTISGTYVSHESGEYSISKDTLLIIPFAGEGNYQVIRKSGYQKIRQGKLQGEELKVRQFTGKYDPDAAILVIDGEEKRIRFFAGAGTLLMAKREYQKVVVP